MFLVLYAVIFHLVDLPLPEAQENLWIKRKPINGRNSDIVGTNQRLVQLLSAYVHVDTMWNAVASFYLFLLVTLGDHEDQAGQGNRYPKIIELQRLFSRDNNKCMTLVLSIKPTGLTRVMCFHILTERIVGDICW